MAFPCFSQIGVSSFFVKIFIPRICSLAKWQSLFSPNFPAFLKTFTALWNTFSCLNGFGFSGTLIPFVRFLGQGFLRWFFSRNPIAPVFYFLPTSALSKSLGPFAVNFSCLKVCSGLTGMGLQVCP